MTFLRDLGLTLIYGAPLAFAGSFAAYHLTKRLRAGGVWPLLIAFGLYVAAMVVFKWQTQSFTGGKTSVGGIAGFTIFFFMAAEAASTRPLLFKPKEKLRQNDATPEKTTDKNGYMNTEEGR